MKNSLLLAFAILLTTFFSCDDTTDTFGMSLTESVNNVTVNADTFFVESHSILAKDIISRSSNNYLGRIKDPETNSYVTCNFMTQFTTMGEFQFPNINNIYIEDYNPSKPIIDQIEADSCEFIVYFNKAYGDSLALMKITAHELNKPYEESLNYTTDFDPIRENMIRNDVGSIHSQVSYTISNRLHTDALRNSTSYLPYFSVSLNNEYTDKDNVRYNNYGTYLMRKFYDEKTKGCFTNNYRFTHEVCPGFYIENIGGIGSLGTINISQIIVYFKSNNDGVAVNSYTSFAGTEEVLRKTNISQDEHVIQELISDNTCTYLKTPAGIFTELTLPIERIMLGRDDESEVHENDTLNTVRMFIPRINDENTTNYNLSIPKTLLLLPTDSIENFFNGKKIADSRYSYLATYSSSTNGYTFTNISSLISKTYTTLSDTINSVIKTKKAELGVTELPESTLKSIKKEVAHKYISNHPTWNKMVLIPVETTYSTLSSGSSILTKVTYDMNLGSTRLIKGNNNSDNIIVSVIYSKFKN